MKKEKKGTHCPHLCEKEQTFFSSVILKPSRFHSISKPHIFKPLLSLSLSIFSLLLSIPIIPGVGGEKMAFLLSYAPLPTKSCPGEPSPLPYYHTHFGFSASKPRTRTLVIVSASATSSPEKKTRKQKKKPKDTDSSSITTAHVSALERNLRLAFMEELMERARSRDSAGASSVIYDMIAAGLTPGPRSFHGLIVSHTLSGNIEGAVIGLSLFC